jgi:hypothetical protein
MSGRRPPILVPSRQQVTWGTRGASRIGGSKRRQAGAPFASRTIGGLSSPCRAQGCVAQDVAGLMHSLRFPTDELAEEGCKDARCVRLEALVGSDYPDLVAQRE